MGPLLYVSPKQINVQAPFEIAGSAQVNLTVTAAQVNQSQSIALPLAIRNPVAFLDSAPSLVDCSFGAQLNPGNSIAMAFNADGSRNTCTKPASPGSVVRLYLSGLGVTTPAPVTGTVNASPGTALNLPVTIGSDSGFLGSVVSVTAAPGLISGVFQVDIRLPVNQTGAVSISLLVDGVPVRDGYLIVWVR